MKHELHRIRHLNHRHIHFLHLVKAGPHFSAVIKICLLFSLLMGLLVPIAVYESGDIIGWQVFLIYFAVVFTLLIIISAISITIFEISQAKNRLNLIIYKILKSLSAKQIINTTYTRPIKIFNQCANSLCKACHLKRKHIQLYVIHSSAPNIISIGNLHRRLFHYVGVANIMITSKLLNMSSPSELFAVLSREFWNIIDYSDYANVFNFLIASSTTKLDNYMISVYDYALDKNLPLFDQYFDLPSQFKAEHTAENITNNSKTYTSASSNVDIADDYLNYGINSYRHLKKLQDPLYYNQTIFSDHFAVHLIQNAKPLVSILWKIKNSKYPRLKSPESLRGQFFVDPDNYLADSPQPSIYTRLHYIMKIKFN